MKKVEAIIHSHKLDDVKLGLVSAGVIGMSISEIKAFGHSKDSTTRYRGTEYRVDFTNKIKIEAVVEGRDGRFGSSADLLGCSYWRNR